MAALIILYLLYIHANNQGASIYNILAINVPVKGAITVVKRRTSTGAFQANYKWEEHNNWGDTLCLDFIVCLKHNLVKEEVDGNATYEYTPN